MKYKQNYVKLRLTHSCEIHLVEKNNNGVPFKQNIMSLETESLVPTLFISVGDLEQSIQFNNSSCTHIFSDISTSNVKLEDNNAQERETKKISISIVDNDSFAAQSSSSASGNTSANLSQDVSRNIKGRPKKGRRRKYPEQNKIVKKTRLNRGQESNKCNGKTVKSKEFQGDHFDCKCPNKCTAKVSAEQRKLEFHGFWIQSFVKQKLKARRYSNTSKRTFTRLYTIVTVCNKLFLNKFGISHSRIDIALAKTNQSVP
ncbi:unnamed protein product [Psylliodes chrysocephalus]|uniref:Uncharacterized protein n=1 Tax=Psylliodes chrysocephalus TaxID=3402493 RepID=A0A9P0G7Z8_9CUCU|nr:unnamed protein product [Psylliodes chrysocephala]